MFALFLPVSPHTFLWNDTKLVPEKAFNSKLEVCLHSDVIKATPNPVVISSGQKPRLDSYDPLASTHP